MSINPHVWRRLCALVPLALVSASGSLAFSGAGAAPEAVSRTPIMLPSAQTLRAPASLAQAGYVAPAVPAGRAPLVVSTASSNGIPSTALAAYQRAAQVIDSADLGCHLGWPLVAAIGRVESDHGRYAGSTLSAAGVATPRIFGPALNGAEGTQRVPDTDRGAYDGDTRFDRAVGPMQFLPSTWLLVGVDADGDGQRNPQDIDDAALATAVYLCSGAEDLATDSGVSSAVFRYNHSAAYVGLVKAIARTYSTGLYTSIPTGFTPAVSGWSHDTQAHNGATHGEHSASSHGASGSPSAAPAPQHPAPATSGPSSGGTKPAKPPAKSPVEAVSDQVASVPETAATTLTALQKATAYCQAHLGATQLDALGGLSACAQAYLDGGAPALNSLLAGLGLLDLLGGLNPQT